MAMIRIDKGCEVQASCVFLSAKASSAFGPVRAESSVRSSGRLLCRL